MAELTPYIVFNIYTENYAFKMGNIIEVINPVPIRNIPKSPDDILGIISYRGYIISVIDPRIKLKIDIKNNNFSKFIIINYENELYALVVWDIEEIIKRNISQLNKVTGTNIIEGIFKAENKEIYVIDLKMLIEEN